MMDGNHTSIFPAQSSILSSGAVLENILTKYQISIPIKCGFYHKGLNDTYRVRSGTSVDYLRIYRSDWRTLREIKEEIRLLNSLIQGGISVSRPIEKKRGGYISRLRALEGTRYAVLFKGAAGAGFNRSNAAHSYNYGSLVGRIHSYMDKQESKYDRTQFDLECLVNRPLRLIAPYFRDRQKDLIYIGRVAENLAARVRDLPTQSPEFGICHGDLHLGNVRFADREVPTVFDFDCFGYGWRAYDLAVFLWSNEFTNQSRKIRMRRWSTFLEGYGNERPLGVHEMESIPVFGALRQIWLMGVHAAGVNDWGEFWVDGERLDNAIAFLRRWIKNYRI